MKKKPHAFHGYKTVPKGEREDCVGLYIGRLPHRKSLCLYASEQNKFCVYTYPLAYFTTEENAKECQRILDHMILNEPSP